MLAGFVARADLGRRAARLASRSRASTARWALAVAALFASAAVLGWRLEHGRARAFEAHAWLGALAVLGAALAAVAGFVLLP